MSFIKPFSKFVNEEYSIGPYVKNIEDDTIENSDYRRVIFTGEKLQIVLMSLKPGQEIGGEVHENGDQFLRFEQGTGVVIIGEDEYEVFPEFGVAIPAGEFHNVINTGSDDLKLYSIYSPPEHPSNTVQTTK